jgi:hypothetical protein
MADVALRGFNLLEQDVTRAWKDGTPSASVALENLGRAYLKFARTEPGYYSAMFEAGIPLDGNSALRDAGERVFAVLRSATEKLIAGLPARSRPPAVMMSLHIWALSHGIASLFGRGDAGRRTLPMTPEDLLEAAILIYREGLTQGHHLEDKSP